MTRIAAFIVAGCLIAAAPIQAQSHGNHGNHGQGARQAAQGQHGDHEGMGCQHGEDAAHRYAPKMLLKHGEMLQFTPQQVEQLEALQERHHADCQERMGRIRAAEEAANAALLSDTPDLVAFEAGMRRAANLKVDCKVDMAKTGQQALALLTAQQRAHLAHMSHGGH
jgi:Spy/CpxP family protein refolding chaperone